MKILITGGAGFIGSHLVKELVRRKYKVIVLDNLSTGSLENLKFVKNKIKFIKFDLSKNKKISKYLKGVDYVFHLAGLISVEDSFKAPIAGENSQTAVDTSLLSCSRNDLPFNSPSIGLNL